MKNKYNTIFSQYEDKAKKELEELNSLARSYEDEIRKATTAAQLRNISNQINSMMSILKPTKSRSRNKKNLY